MIHIVQKLKSFFGKPGEQKRTDSMLNQTIQEWSTHMRSVDPDTDRQWMRLQRSLAQGEARAGSTRSRIMVRFALGGATAVLALAVAYFYFTSTQSPPNTFLTGVGERKEIVLHDGSQVTLNYATQLDVRRMKRGEARHLSLAGEAYFRVERNETPFIVSTRCAEVRVVGTEFDLKEREGTLEIGVVKGIVRVSASRDGKDSTLSLTEHQMALCSQSSFPRRAQDPLSPEYPGWMHAKLILNGTSLRLACREIEMRFNVAITVDEPDANQKLITGILDAQSATSAIGALCEVTGHHFTHEGQSYHIY